jgi:hypothetical protein
MEFREQLKARISNAKDYMPVEEISIVKDILYGQRELFLPGYEEKIEYALNEAMEARDLGVPDEAQREIDRAILYIAVMFQSKESREKAKKDAALFKLIEDARARGQATRLAREPPPPPPPAFPIFATAPPGDGGRRRRSRRGRKSRRKSLRQRK